MKRSTHVAAPLLASAALAFLSGCRQQQMKRCVDQNNKIVDDSFCNAQQQPGANGSSSNPFYGGPYRWYYGGSGGYGTGGTASGGSYAPSPGVSYATSTTRGGFGSFFSGGDGGGEAGEGGHGGAGE